MPENGLGKWAFAFRIQSFGFKIQDTSQDLELCRKTALANGLLVSGFRVQDSGYIPGLGIMLENGLGKWASGFRIEDSRFRIYPRTLSYARKWPWQMGLKMLIDV